MNLSKAGFHVIEIRKFREIENLPLLLHDTSIINLVRDIDQNKLQKFTVVDGLDEFMRSSTEEAIEQVRESFNKGITDMLTIDASLVFVVKSDIKKIPDNPSVYDRPLAMIFPRPHDIGSMEPGYLYYPIM